MSQPKDQLAGVKPPSSKSTTLSDEALPPDEDDLVNDDTQTNALTPDQIAANEALEQEKLDADKKALEKQIADIKAKEADVKAKEEAAKALSNSMSQATQASSSLQSTGAASHTASIESQISIIPTKPPLLNSFKATPTNPLVQQENRLTATQTDTNKYTPDEKMRIKQIIESHKDCSVQFPENSPAKVAGPAENLIKAIKACDGIGTFSKGPFTLNFNIKDVNDPKSIEKIQAKINELLLESINSGVPINNITINGKSDSGLVTTYPDDVNKPISSIKINSPNIGNEPNKPRVG